MIWQWTSGNKARLPGYLGGRTGVLWNDLAKPLYTSIPADRIQLVQVQCKTPRLTGLTVSPAHLANVQLKAARLDGVELAS